MWDRCTILYIFLWELWDLGTYMLRLFKAEFLYYISKSQKTNPATAYAFPRLKMNCPGLASFLASLLYSKKSCCRNDAKCNGYGDRKQRKTLANAAYFNYLFHSHAIIFFAFSLLPHFHLTP